MRLIGTDENPLEGTELKAGMVGEVTYQGNKVFFREASYHFNENKLSGDLDLDLTGRPMLAGKIKSDALNLSAFTSTEPADGQGKKATAANDGWSEDVIDLSGLNAVDADVVLIANSVDLGVIKVGATRLRARLERGRLVLAINNIAAYGGQISGDYVVNARTGLSMRGDIRAKGVQLQPLLVDMADYDRLIAGMRLKLDFLTSGSSVRSMMENLSGSGDFAIGKGELFDLDLGGMLRNFDTAYRGEGAKTIFSNIGGSFEITDGVLSNADLNFEGDVVDASGEGAFDIGRRTVSYKLTPVAFASDDPAGAAGISVPILIKGPWSNLRYSPDLKGLFDEELEKQRAEAEEKLRENVDDARKKAEERLREEADKAIEKSLGDLLKKLGGENQTD